MHHYFCLLMSCSSLYGYILHFLIHLLVNGQLSCLRANTIVTIWIVFLWTYGFFPLGWVIEVHLLDCVCIYGYLTFSETAKLFSTNGRAILQFCCQCLKVPVLHILTNVWYCKSFYYSHSSGSVMVCHCCFNIDFSDDSLEHLMCLFAM